MADITSGWFALGGALIGAVATQVTTIISTVSKSKARKQKAAQETAAAKAAKRRPLYEGLIYDLDQAAEYIAWIIRTLDNPGKGPADRGRGLQRKLSAVRAQSVSVQIDGSDRAKAIATGLLAGTRELWQQVTESAGASEDALTQAHDTVTKGHAEMIDVARADFGG